MLIVVVVPVLSLSSGLVQQLHTEQDHETGCLHHYCGLAGYAASNKRCPHIDQISVITVSYLDSRGPEYARTMMV